AEIMNMALSERRIDVLHERRHCRVSFPFCGSSMDPTWDSRGSGASLEMRPSEHAGDPWPRGIPVLEILVAALGPQIRDRLRNEFFQVFRAHESNVAHSNSSLLIDHE